MSQKKDGQNLKSYRARVKGRPTKSPGGRWSFLLVVASLLILIFIGSFALKFSTGETSPPPKEPVFVRFQILNGCGELGIAGRFSRLVVERTDPDFIVDVIDEGNFESFSQEKTLLIVRQGSKTDAEAIAGAIGLTLEQIVYKELEDNFLDINYTLVVGKDFHRYL